MLCNRLECHGSSVDDHKNTFPSRRPFKAQCSWAHSPAMPFVDVSIKGKFSKGNKNHKAMPLEQNKERDT